jgi:hypothetical protein
VLCLYAETMELQCHALFMSEGFCYVLRCSAASAHHAGHDTSQASLLPRASTLAQQVLGQVVELLV